MGVVGKKKIFWWLILVIIVILLVILIISIRSVDRIYVQIDQIDDGKLIYNPYSGDSLELEVGGEATISIDYDPNKKLVFEKCSYDKKIIGYKNRTITAKKKGKTELVCEVMLNNKIKSNPISIVVN